MKIKAELLHTNFPSQVGQLMGITANIEPEIRLPRKFNVVQARAGVARSGRSWLQGRTMLCVGTCPAFLTELGALFDARVLATECPETEGIGQFSALLPDADCVLCPAKGLSETILEDLQQCCKLQHKPFVPLRNDSRTCYRHAFMKLADQLLRRPCAEARE